MNLSELKELNDAERLIQEIVRYVGLDLFRQGLGVVAAQKLLEIMDYCPPLICRAGASVATTKWSAGGMSTATVPLKDVFNSATLAFLMNTKPFVIRVLVVAYAYAHNDWLKKAVTSSALDGA